MDCGVRGLGPWRPLGCSAVGSARLYSSRGASGAALSHVRARQRPLLGSQAVPVYRVALWSNLLRRFGIPPQVGLPCLSVRTSHFFRRFVGLAVVVLARRELPDE